MVGVSQLHLQTLSAQFSTQFQDSSMAVVSTITQQILIIMVIRSLHIKIYQLIQNLSSLSPLSTVQEHKELDSPLVLVSTKLSWKLIIVTHVPTTKLKLNILKFMETIGLPLSSTALSQFLTKITSCLSS